MFSFSKKKLEKSILSCVSMSFSSLSTSRSRLSSDEIGCLMSVLSEGLRPVKGARCAPAPPDDSHPHAAVGKKFQVALDAVEHARAAEDERSATLYVSSQGRRTSSEKRAPRRPYTAGAVRPPTAQRHTRAETMRISPQRKPEREATLPPGVVGQSLFLDQRNSPSAARESGVAKQASSQVHNRPLTAPPKSSTPAGGARPTSARPLSSKRRDPQPTAKFHSIVHAVCHQEKLARARDEEDADVGIVDDDGDAEEDAQLEELMHHTANPSRVPSAKSRPPLSAAAARPQSSTRLPQTQTSVSESAPEDQEGLHVLGTADAAHVRGDVPSPLYFGRFRFHNISDFLQHQKRETFGQYYQHVAEYMSKRGHSPPGCCAAARPTSAGGSFLPSPAQFVKAVDLEFHQRRIEEEGEAAAQVESTVGDEAAQRSAAVMRALRCRSALDKKSSGEPQLPGRPRRPLRGPNFSAVKASVNRW